MSNETSNQTASAPAVASGDLLGGDEITLTIQQIKELAEFAGLIVKPVCSPLDDEDMEAEITVVECPNGHEVIEEDGSRVRHKHVAYFTEYPEEGVCPIGRPNENLKGSTIAKT